MVKGPKPKVAMLHALPHSGLCSQESLDQSDDWRGEEKTGAAPGTAGATATALTKPNQRITQLRHDLIFESAAPGRRQEAQLSSQVGWELQGGGLFRHGWTRNLRPHERCQQLCNTTGPNFRQR